MRQRWEIVTPETPGAGPFTAGMLSRFLLGEKWSGRDLWCVSIDVMTFTDQDWIVIANYDPCDGGADASSTNR